MIKARDVLREYADAAWHYAVTHPGCSPLDAIEAAVPKERRSDDWDSVMKEWRAFLDEQVDETT